jgi:hypothetical protein
MSKNDRGNAIFDANRSSGLISTTIFGRALVDLALDGADSLPIDFLSLRQFSS